MKKEENEEKNETVVDETLIYAFNAAFFPVQSVEDADEMFTDSDLRRILSAYNHYGAPDPMVDAKMMLGSLGFISVLLPDSTPVLLAGRRKNVCKDKDFTQLIAQLPEVDNELTRFAMSLEEEEREESEKDKQYIPFDMKEDD